MLPDRVSNPGLLTSESGALRIALHGPVQGKDKNWLLKTGDPLIQVHLHCILVQGTQKMWLLQTGDPLTEATT